ncbi:MAG: EutN/CcmL family microcompartment protein [Deferribacteres bacterium]|nr:EutN/CcmL family microcompartment protein [candidate division KSB1 bacterium]MCB9502414.1 EutN/CcmL family microcompartment protein [Deferribacteres bacterium]
MELARIEGTVVSTVKAESLKGRKLLLANLLNADATATDNYLVAIDSVGAGIGEVVLIVRGSSARQTESLGKVPTDSSIIAIVDSIELKGAIVYEK